jgi:chemotaxis protein CheD
MFLKPNKKKAYIDFPDAIKKKGPDKKETSIHIGEYYASKVPTIIYTLLGSCVAVCLYDRKKRIGGMNHILLPGNASNDSFKDCARYGINAMELLIDKIVRLGGAKKNLTSKVFGGANLLPSIPYERCVGKKNVFFVLNFLSQASIPVLSQDVGGNDSRKIFFHTDTGDVFLRRSLSIHYQNILDQEKKALKNIQKQKTIKPNDILFY